VTAVALPLRRIGAAWPSVRLPTVTPGRLAFLLYLALGGYLALALHAFHGDAYSRVANAYYVLFSRDPHLAAIGFVWTPLPSLFELAFLPAKIVWPGIAQLGLPAVVMSATFMGLAVREIDLILRDFGLGRITRLGLVAAFALHPAIVYYGAIGTSEAPVLFFALLACRNLARYAVTPSTASLVGVGFALAGAFLTRYEAVPAAVGVALAIVWLTLLRLPGTVRQRLGHAGGDIVVALTPFVLVFIGWSLASWIVVGSPFVQFTSDYGNSSQMRVWAAAGANEIGLAVGPSIALAGLRLTALSIVAPIALLAALWALIVRRDYRVLAIGAVLGPILAFMIVAYLFHLLAPWLRYFISVVPLGIILVGLCIAPRVGAERAASTGQWRATVAGVRVRLAAGIARMRSRLTDRATSLTSRIAIGLVVLALLASGFIARLEPLKTKSATVQARLRALVARAFVGAAARLEPISTQSATLQARLRARLSALAAGASVGAAARLEPISTKVATLDARVRAMAARASVGAAAMLEPINTKVSTLQPRLRVLAARVSESTARLAPLSERLARLRARSAALATRVSGRVRAVAAWVTPRLAAVGSSVRTRVRGIARIAVRFVGMAVRTAAVRSGQFAVRLARALAPRLAPLVPAAALALALVSVPVAAFGMLDRTVAVEESKDIGALLGPQAAEADRPGAALRTFAGEQKVAAYLDSMDLPRGSVLMDVFSAFPIALWSERPEQFIITTDHDFKQVLADPPTFGVRYILAPSLQGNGIMDAVNRAYPDLATTTGGFATLVHTFPGIGTSATWSLYGVTAP
jgi:hypothetical protein